MGTMPMIMASAVISTGRKRVTPASIAARTRIACGRQTLAREAHHQDRIGGGDPHAHQGAGQRGHRQRRAGGEQNPDDARQGRRKRGDDHERIVVNFQSWLDPFVIITALPAALAGIVWMLFATGTTLSVPALTGAIMCMGVATANSILVVSFARERLAATGDAVRAAMEAGFTRFRPVLMTALAMIIGMPPMALGMGEGGEQNAPLGRAVIGGLVFATVATLMFVPVVFSIVHGSKTAEPPGQPIGRPGAQSGEIYA